MKASGRKDRRNGSAGTRSGNALVRDRRSRLSESRFQTDRPVVSDIRRKASEGRRTRLKAKAQKAYDRQYGEDPASMSSSAKASSSRSRSTSSSGSARAALYKGMMGRSQKRSQRLQESRSSAKAHSTARSADGEGAVSKARASVSAFAGKARKPLIAVCVIALLAVFLYSPAQQYYTQVRNNDYLQAEYDAASAQTDSLRSEISYLDTDEGVQDRAREELGYVMSDETAGAVKGANLIKDESDSEDTTINVQAYSVEMPSHWYSPMLDALFGWNSDI